MPYASPQPRRINPPVCPLPRSLATTSGISVDFSSSPYLDVSVQAVPFLHLFCSMQDDGVLRRRVSPFGNSGIIAYVRLPQTYRSLSRPSSALDAKAFPLRSYQLDLVEAKSIPFGTPFRVFLTPFPCFSSPNRTHFVGLRFGTALRAVLYRHLRGFLSEILVLIKNYAGFRFGSL